MMGQIEKRKKKGRPSKADLARRVAAAAEENEVRRSSRSRNVCYDEDYDDDELEEEYDLRRRREKKLKVLRGGGDSERRRVAHAPPDSDDDDVDNKEIELDTEVRVRKAGSNDADSVPGTPPDLPMRVVLPDKKTLELVLDKLQKKDTYGVYAEPVDPDELPDYHDVIEHPMDFATVRKKLGKGSYSTLEQFENDIHLICSNAMQYNAPDTIYHKQALSIQELAKRKFQSLRCGAEQYEKEPQSEQKPISNSLGPVKQIKKPLAQTAPETVASDLSPAATPATLEDLQPVSTTKASCVDRLSNVDESVDGTATQSDNNLDKAEDLPSGKGHNSRLARKALVHDDNHRATYNISTQPVSRPDSAFSIFDGEIKELVAVGLNADHSYARSLARFASTLGPVAWNVASKKIEQVLPPDIKFGRGWVGDYEPISTPVIVTQNCSKKETDFRKDLNIYSNPNKDKGSFINAQFMNKRPNSEGKSASFDASGNTTVSPTSCSSFPSKPQPYMEEILDVKPNIGASVNHRVQSPRVKNIQSGKKVKKRVELNSLPSGAADTTPRQISSEKQSPNVTSMNHPVSLPMKQPQNNGLSEVMNEKSPSNQYNIHRKITSVNNDRNPTSMPSNYFPHGHDQSLTDPVQLMRRLTENAQKQQQNPMNPSTTDSQLVQSSRKEDPSNASSAAARAWMSIGASSPKSVSENTSGVNNRNQIFVNSLHSPTQVSRFRNDFPVPGMQFHHMNNNINNNNFPAQGFMSPQFRTGNEAQFQNQQQMVFPQLVTADLSRFQMQSSPRQVQHQQRRQLSQKQEMTIPPDLNLVFQSSGSPGRQSSGLQVDSQQPDLALQL